MAQRTDPRSSVYISGSSLVAEARDPPDFFLWFFVAKKKSAPLGAPRRFL